MKEFQFLDPRLPTATRKDFSKRRAVFAASAVLLMMMAAASPAVLLKSSGDPSFNTTPPTGALANSGWELQGEWGSMLGTPIAAQYFIAARHVGGSVGGTFIFQGAAYTTTAYFDDTNSDLRIWKVNGVFPFWAPLYSTADEQGKPLVVMGRGTQRGDAVVIVVEQTHYTTNTFTLKSMGLNPKSARQLYPNAIIKSGYISLVTSSVTTNEVLKGWRNGPADGVMRWGENHVSGTGSYLAASFDLLGGDNEAFLSGGDSSGGVFIPSDGVWKLAGINYGIEGPYATDPAEPEFFGAIFDVSGLYTGGILMPNDGYLRPTRFYATRISTRISWIESIIGTLP